ncbi:MAG: haloacid dehalogenase [Anaerolineae bacterium]|jgi:translin|nr:haloacid dehalogenase [Anaerolineae bacterium]
MTLDLDAWLDGLAEVVQEDWRPRNAARDQVLNQSRELIRLCSQAIRAGHREEWESAQSILAEADAMAHQIRVALEPYPDLFYAGYTQDALKELVEAHLTLVLVANRTLPSPTDLAVPYAAYLNGLCEAASELRRRCLDCMRQGQMAEAERLLAIMDSVYEVLMSFDYPDALTGGLRHRVDQLRAVLERTRGDLTNGLQMQRLLEALQQG